MQQVDASSVLVGEKRSRRCKDIKNTQGSLKQCSNKKRKREKSCTFSYLYLCAQVCVCVFPTSKVSLREEVLDEVSVSGEEEVVQLVYTHADRGVDVQPPAQVGAERLHFTCRDRKQERFC